MKKKLIIGFSILLFLIATVAIANYFSPVGQMTAFHYRSGHAWYGHHSYELVMVGNVPWAVESFEPADIENGPGPQEPWTRSRELSEKELRAFELLVVRQLRLPTWPAETGPDPSHITDQDSWSVSFTYEGEVYHKTGYYEFPDGLTKIADFLSVPEIP